MKSLPELWKKALFKRFKRIYGAKFSDQFCNEIDYFETMQEWGEALGDLSGDQIKEGLEACRLRVEWPPSIAEFRRLCLGGVASSCHRLFVKRDPVVVNAALARQALQEMRGML